MAMVTPAATEAAASARRKGWLHPIAAVSMILSFAVGANSLTVNSRKPSLIRSHDHNNLLLASMQPKPNQFEAHSKRRQAAFSSPLGYATSLRQSSLSMAEDEDAQKKSSDDDSNKTTNNIFNRDLSVPVVLLGAFLNLLGFTMLSPIQPALGKHFDLPLGASFGSLSSAYPLGMLFGVFLWPTLSDVLGRKKIISLTLMGSGLGLMLQSWGIQRCWPLESFLAARVLTGCFAGNSPISKAYLADRGWQGKKGDLSRYLAWKDAASTLAFIVGPALGGLTYSLFGGVTGNNSNRISFVIFCSAMASIFASLSVMLFMKDNTPSKADTKTTNEKDNGTSSKTGNKDSEEKKDAEAIVSCPLGTKLWTGVLSVACVSGLYHAADSTFFAFFPSLLQNQLGFDTKAVGMAFTSFAVVSISISAFVSSKFMNAFGPVASCTTGLAAVGTGLMTLGYAASLPVGTSIGVISAIILGASAFYYTGVPLYGPSVPAMLLQCVPPHKRGAVMGFDGAVNTIARIVSPLIIGEIHRLKGAGACFRVAGACAYASLSMALFRRWVVLRKSFAKSESNA